MKTAVFSTKKYDEDFLTAGNDRFGHELAFFEPRLTPATAPLARGFPGICVFVNDVLNEEVLNDLADHGLQAVALRCAGFNNVDLPTAERRGVQVVRVPAYSPHSIAEHTIAMLLCLNRRLHRAYTRVRDGNFALQGLMGFDLHGRTVGVVGTGRIGQVVIEILRGFGCRVLASDLLHHPEVEQAGGQYVELDTLFTESDIITLHCPLTPDTRHLINSNSIRQMKRGIVLVNTSRGAIVDTAAAIEGLKSGHVGGLAIDVYEEEADLFFEDLSSEVLHDDVFARLLTFPNVLITGHQAFFTREAVEQIAVTTLSNLAQLESTGTSDNLVTSHLIRPGKKT
ncbi:MAG: 2-hydroxyacid dehydrogenase [Fuerstiella sp.]